MDDEQIEALIADEDNGSWHTDREGMRVYTANPSIFADVTPHKLLMYFINRDPSENLRLHLP